MGKISLSYIANTSHTHACVHARAHTRSYSRTRTPHPHNDGRCSQCRCAQPWLRRGWATPFRRWPDNAGRWPFINRRAGDPISSRFLKFFAYTKNARPNWDVNSWQNVLSDDTNSYRHIPRLSSKSCDRQTDRQTDIHTDRQTDRQTDRLKKNYSIEYVTSYFILGHNLLTLLY